MQSSGSAVEPQDTRRVPSGRTAVSPRRTTRAYRRACSAAQMRGTWSGNRSQAAATSKDAASKSVSIELNKQKDLYLNGEKTNWDALKFAGWVREGMVVKVINPDTNPQ